MRSAVAVALLALACYREAYPCDEETEAVLLANCAAQYEQCRFAGQAADCPATGECEQIARERQEHCASGPKIAR